MRKTEDFRVLIVALLVAFVLASNDVSRSGFSGTLLSYAYWTCRILMESLIFLGFLYAVERYLSPRLSRWLTYAAAIGLSLLLFTLAVTSFDLILGLPELGLNDSVQQPASRFHAFRLEVLYLLDNHVALCVLLLFARGLLRRAADQNEDPSGDASLTGAPPVRQSSFLETLDPPLRGPVLWIEAQEHYIRITTPEESRMVLYRFSDAIRELPISRGMQVHRSHWISFAAVNDIKREGQNLKLTLSNDSVVPVSRSFRAKVEEQFVDLIELR